MSEEAVIVGACSIETQCFRRKHISELLSGGVGQGDINANSGKREELYFWYKSESGDTKFQKGKVFWWYRVVDFARWVGVIHNCIFRGVVLGGGWLQ
jgi:hypothetical protein